MRVGSQSQRKYPEILNELGAGSERRWRTNKLGGGGKEDHGSFGHKSCQRRRKQNRRGQHRLDIQPGVGRRANRAGVMRCGRVLGMRVGCLYRPHHTHQGDREQAYSSDPSAPICQRFQNGIPKILIRTLSHYHDFTVRWSSADRRRRRNWSIPAILGNGHSAYVGMLTRADAAGVAN